MSRRHRAADHEHDDQRTRSTDVAPGKRTLTGSLPPREPDAEHRPVEYMTASSATAATASHDDPFGMHLIGAAGKAHGKSHGKAHGRRGRRGGAAAAQTPAESHLRALITDVRPTEAGVRIAVGAGTSDGIDASWRVHVLGCKLEWKVTEVRPNVIILESRRGQLDDVLGLQEVDLRGVRREAPAAAEPPADDAANDPGAASDADEPAWWTFED